MTLPPLSYHQWLGILALLFIALERGWPLVRAQRILRAGWHWDAAYLVFNSKVLGMLLGYLTAPWIGRLDAIVGRGWLRAWPWWAQFAVLLIAIDFAKWAIHNLLHRVPALWEFHKVHHSIVEMDWLGNWRFHWAEVLVYSALLYLPGALLGAPPEVGLAVGVVDTAVGHFAHANLRWRTGWLNYLFNSPELHRWHHNHPDCGPVNRNFALTLSIWDWIFGTAYLPGHNPARFGFTGIESFPRSLPSQWWEPWRALTRRR